MKVKCISNKISDIPEDSLRKIRKFINIDEFQELEIGEIYDVFAIEFFHHQFIYIESIEGMGFPSRYPMDLFEIDDNTIRDDWVIGNLDISGCTMTLISFREWVEDNCFYERLVDGDEKTSALYENLK